MGAPCACRGRHVRKPSRAARRTARGRGRALAGLRTHGRPRHRGVRQVPDGCLLAVASRVLAAPSAIDGGRSRIPLRGSPGVSPGSLLPLPVDAVTHPHRASSRAGEDQHVHHIRGWATGATPTCCVPERSASWGGKPVPRRVRRATTQSVRPAPSFPHPALPQEGGKNHGHAFAGHSVRRGRVSAAPTSATTAKPISTANGCHRSAPTSAWSRTAATASTA